ERTEEERESSLRGCDVRAVQQRARRIRLMEERAEVAERPVLGEEVMSRKDLLERLERRDHHPDEREDHERRHADQYEVDEGFHEAVAPDRHQRSLNRRSRRLTRKNCVSAITTMTAKYPQLIAEL